MESFDTIVIGCGAAGSMAFLRSVLYCDRTLVLTGDADTQRRSRGVWVGAIDNIPGMQGVARPVASASKATLSWIAEHPQLARFGTAMEARAEKIEADGERFLVHWNGGRGVARARFVVLATGVSDIQPLIQGSMRSIFPYAARREAIYCIRSDGHLTIEQPVVVIGSSTTAARIAAVIALRYRPRSVALCSNGAEPAFSREALAALQARGVEVHTAPITELLADHDSGLAALRLEDGQTLDCTRLVVSLGTNPCNALLLALGGEVDESGRAVVTSCGESSLPGLFVVGDLAAGKKMQVYSGWDTAVDAVDEINLRLRRNRS
jgi:thioredoxin reductase (NADPH)